MKDKLFDYVERDNWVFNLSGVSKLICFIILTIAVMYTFDVRLIAFILALSIWVLYASGIKFSQIKVLMYYVLVFLVMNFILTYLFDPQYGVKLYGSSHEIFRFSTRYTVTWEQLLYQGSKTLKYASVVPLGMMFILTTNPSEFASSLNGVGVSYKVGYALSLTLRYFPDTIRNYNDISVAQQSRGLDLSKKEKLGTRLKNMLNIFFPLILSTMDRIDVISNAMDLRAFGKHKKRTWYAKTPKTWVDYVCIAACLVVLAVVLIVGICFNGGRYWNPFA